MSSVPGFVGPSNVLRASNQDDERTINFYVEGTAPGTGKSPSTLLGTPCLTPFAQVLTTPGRGSFAQDDRAFVVVGTTFAEVFSDGTTLARGTVATDSLHATITSLGTAFGDQMLIVSGGQGYVYDLTGNTLTTINNTNYPGTGFPYGSALQGDILETYGVVTVVDSNEAFFSAPNDMSSWDPLDFIAQYADNNTSLKRSHQEMWFLGSKTTQPWVLSGDALSPFTRIPSVLIESGSAATFGVVRLEDTLIWLSKDERGQAMVMAANGYTPRRISTHAVEQALSAVTDFTTAVAFPMQQRGHQMYWLMVPGLDTTWVFDATTGMWHERAMWDAATASWLLHRANSAMLAFGTTLVTDYTSGVIYELSFDVFADVLA